MSPVPSGRYRSAVLIVTGNIRARPDSIVLAFSLAQRAPLPAGTGVPGSLGSPRLWRWTAAGVCRALGRRWSAAGTLPGARLRRVRAGGFGPRCQCAWDIDLRGARLVPC